MSNRTKLLFFMLIAAQGLHSVEEYLGRLWEVFPPATLLTSFISNDLEVGFLVINIGLFVFGVWCWIWPVRRNLSYATGLIWFWIVLELINGIGHPVWSFIEGGYTVGIFTAPLLLILAILVILEIRPKI